MLVASSTGTSSRAVGRFLPSVTIPARVHLEPAKGRPFLHLNPPLRPKRRHNPLRLGARWWQVDNLTAPSTTLLPNPRLPCYSRDFVHLIIAPIPLVHGLNSFHTVCYPTIQCLRSQASLMFIRFCVHTSIPLLVFVCIVFSM